MSRWFVMGNLHRPIIPFKVNLLYWKPGKGDNVGDLLSLVIYKFMCELYRKRGGGGQRFPLIKTRRIVAIGSVLSFIGGGKTTVWGTGLMNKECVKALLNPDKKAKLDIRCVRGPETRQCLIAYGFDCPAIYGDPAILLPRFYWPKVETEKGKVIIIPHHSKLEQYSGKYTNVLDTYTSDWQTFVKEILSAEKVISSSLHGIILAEAYGIPCVWLYDIPDSPFKYEDYYSSTGRTKYPVASDINSAMHMTGETNLKVKEMQDALIASFPFDIL